MSETLRFWISIGGSFIAATVLSFLLTPLAIRIAHKVGAVDVPRDNRRAHTTPTPRMGGVAIFAACLIAFFGVGYALWGKLDSSFLFILIGSLILVVMGILDDIYTLKPLLKLVIQFAAALIPALNGVTISRLTNLFSPSAPRIELGIWSVPITVLWIVAITNAVNWLDGLDGLACGISAISAFCMFIISLTTTQDISTIALVCLFGSCLGFFPFNRHPAKTFMGDTGSQFLGYMLGALSVQGMFKLYAAISFLIPVILLALPLGDMIVTIFRRILTGHNPMHADRSHIHHRLMDMGFSHRQVVSILHGFSFLLGCIAMVFTMKGYLRLVFLVVSIFFLFFFLLNLRKQYKNRKPISSPPPPQSE